MLGPLLFVIFINNLSKKIIKDTKLYADDTKVISINRCQDSKLSQEDINTLVKWSEEWTIKFNESKCKVMYFGKQNPKLEYIMNNTILSETTIEKDLGIYISNNLEWGHHINTAVGKANNKLGLIKNSFEYLDETSLILLYKSLVRPHLEYGASIWSPQWKKDILKLESVQRYQYNNFRIRRQLTNSRIRHRFFTNLCIYIISSKFIIPSVLLLSLLFNIFQLTAVTA